MATILTPDYSNFIGSPIIVPVQAGSPAGATFHRVRIMVTINDAASFEFSTPVSSGGETVRFDISSAFRAFAESHEYTPTTLNAYPDMSAVIKAYDDYMVDGVEQRGKGESTANISPLYCGHLTDMERLLGLDYPATGRYSRKPTSSPELAFVGYEFLQPGPCASEVGPVAPAVTTVTVPSGSVAGSNIYGISAPQDGYELRFINSLGVHENVFLTGFPKREVNISTEQYVISRQETLSQFSRGLAVKQNDHETWTLSSGPLDRQWQAWYVHEVLMARWAWLRIGGNYIPCNILPEESLTLYDRQKPEVMTVPVVVQLDINGDPIY